MTIYSLNKRESQKFAKNRLSQEFAQFSDELFEYLGAQLKRSFFRFEAGKTVVATVLYRQRGRYAKRLMHSSMATLAAFGVMIAPVVAKEFPGENIDPWELSTTPAVLSATTQDPDTTTDKSTKPRDQIIKYEVQDGDTVSGVAEKFGISIDTILWQNGLSANSKIKPGQEIEILPVTGVSHKVVKGDTIYSIAKKYDSEAQAIVNFPFNSFANDETFELAVGQTLIVPEGIKPNEKPAAPRVRQLTPDAGTVFASGNFVWPTAGTITQRFSWYHKGIDVANRAAPDILAADSGKVVVAGWVDNYGYGNRVVIDHGNGYRTLYAHMSNIYVVVGQTVARGSAIGRMGSTGRSTGTHLHFEVINGSHLNPLGVLE